MTEKSFEGLTTGIDIVYIPKFEMKNQTFLSKIFQPSELENLDPPHLAGVFAAKESISKALDLSPGMWLEMEIRYEPSGKPFVELSEKLKKKVKKISISITHDNDYAIAHCIALKKD